MSVFHRVGNWLSPRTKRSLRSGRARISVEGLEERLAPALNPIVAENLLAGTPESVWNVVGSGDPTIQGYATDISVDQGQTISFKINDPGLAPYHINIYRIGYYGGMGARHVATIPSSQTLRFSQPAPLTDPTTGLVDAGNWAVSASWAVPGTAVSGVYVGNLVREDTGGTSQVIFIVRDDDGQSDMLFQTSDTTWQAYNRWGGNSLYTGSPVGRAYQVSYNRPFSTRTDTVNGRDYFFGIEYAMVRWLEASGYNVSYFTDVDSARNGAEIKEHKAFLSVGHDEYWSGEQRAAVEAARDAGVNLAFFSGNEVYWKTRWLPSIDTSQTAYRTLTCYKETLAGAKIDPSPIWTGLWRDATFSQPSDNVIPENALTGTIFTVNRGPGGETGTSFNVPSQFANLRFWRNTSVAALLPGQTAVLGDQVLGYEWDEDLDNGARPAGLITMSSTTQNVPQWVVDGVTVIPASATHSLTMYRAASGALVFGAGTVQWAWGLDGTHDGPTTTPSLPMQQSTVNLFADMGVQPQTPQPGIVPAFKSTDAVAPTSVITSPVLSQQVTAGTPITITGTAADTGGGVLAMVEVSTDGGQTWHRASGLGSWTYTWTPLSTGPVTIKSRAVDDGLNLQPAPASVAVTVKPTATSTTGLVSAYGFNEGSGGTVNNAAGAGNSGAVSGATWTAGKFGQALSFNGTSNWVTVNDSASLDLTNGMTIEAWVRPTTLNDFSTVIMKERPSGMSYGMYAADGSSNPPSAYINTGSESGLRGGTSALPLSTWSHLATTYDGTMLRIYLNGAEVGSKIVVGPMITSTGALRIGGNSIWGEYFHGLIDEVRIYNRPLGVTEILTDMSTPVGGTLETTTPTGAITSPASSSTVSGTINVAANASDNVIVIGVQLLVDGQPVGAEDTVAPYSVSWNSGTVPNGNHSLAVRVRDAAGNYTITAGTAITVSNTAPPASLTAAITYPAANARIAGGSVVNVVATSTLGILGVQLRLNGVNVGPEATTTPYLIALNTSGYADGAYQLDAVVRDTTGNVTTSSPVTVILDSTAPSVTAHSPASAGTLIDPATNITATFNESVFPNSVQFQLRDASNNIVPTVFSYDDVNNKVTLNPVQDLHLGATYTATLSGGQDLAGNLLGGGLAWSFTTSNQVVNAKIWDDTVTPTVASAADIDPIEVGVKFQTDVPGYITGLRFYKGSENTGTHIGHLWDAAGNQLAAATFLGETATGWQQVNFASAVAVAANTTYVASYYAPNGGYAADANYFLDSGFGSGRVRALSNTEANGNGVYRYVTGGGYPTSSFSYTNYWVDVVFSNVLTDITPPTVLSSTPAAGATNVATTSNITATFSEQVESGTISFTLRDPANNFVSAPVSVNDAMHSVTLIPSGPLADGTTYTAILSGARDLAGNTMADVSWSFTTGAVDVSPPAVIAQGPSAGATSVAPATNISVTFNESVRPGTISLRLVNQQTGLDVAGQLSYNDATRTATFFATPSDGAPAGCCGGCSHCPLATSTNFTVILSGVEDLAGNVLTTASWGFTTDQTILNRTIWASSATPAVASANDPAAIEVGLKFRSDSDGWVTGLRFYKGGSNTGTHVGHLWDTGGSVLGTATFTDETATGWQQVNFAIPVLIAANTTYVASYYAPNGGYAVDASAFASTGFDSAPLHALSNAAAGGNGVYRYGAGGGFPTDTFNSANYWVDVVFSNTTTDLTAPTTVATTPAASAVAVSTGTSLTATFSEGVQAGTIVMVLTDPGNNPVAGTVSYDQGTNVVTFAPSAVLSPSTTYTMAVSGAKDAVGNTMAPVSWSFTTGAAITNATIWGPATTPAVASAADNAALELGLKFRSSVGGYITGLRFYKGAGNTGTHVGHLWDAGGAALATATFAGETATGWQQVTFASPVAIAANTTYVASYYAPNGGYSYDHGFFAASGFTNSPLYALANGENGGNGMYRYGVGGGFPTNSFNSTNYWVDVVFSDSLSDSTPPTVTARTPAIGATGVVPWASVTATFSEGVQAGTIVMVLTDPGNNPVAGTVSYDQGTNVVTFAPAAVLSPSTTYTMAVSGAKDAVGNTMAPVSWSFTTGAAITNATIWGPATTPAVASAADNAALELGLKFRSSVGGYITGLRFYKGAGNTGTHVGHLWDAGGAALATATFAGETATGWQQVTFASPVAIAANTTYVASYYAPNGGYSYDGGAFATSGVSNGPLSALSNAEASGNGLYRYGVGGGFPTNSFNSTNYWVDVVFSESVGDSTLPTVTTRTPAVGATGVAPWASVTATFSEAVQAGTISMVLRDPSNNVVPASVSYDASSMTATLTPTSDLTPLISYTVTVSGTMDLVGNTMATLSWSFTTANTWKQSGTDFNGGTHSGTSSPFVGPLQLATTFSDDFNGGSLGAAWGTSSWTSQGGGTTDVTVANGVLSVLGGLVTSAASFDGKSVEGSIQFGATPYQHFGLATGLDSVAGSYWALFGTSGSSDTLYARVNSSGTTQDVVIGPLPSGFHTYRIEPVATGFRFLVDGVLQATINITFPTGTAAKIALSAFRGSPNPALQASWVRIAEYGSTGTFTSSTFDAGSAVTWGLVKWNAQTPTGTSISVEVSVSNDPNSGWSTWAALTSGSSVSTVVGSTPMRYIRYRVILTTTDSSQTPIFQDVTFTY